MDNYNNGVPSVGYTEVKRKIKILKAVAVVLTVLSCLGSVPVGILFLVASLNMDTDFFGPLLSWGYGFFGVALLISCAVSVVVVWLLYYALKKRVEQRKAILPLIIIVAVVWFVPKLLSIFVGVISALAENNLNFIM